MPMDTKRYERKAVQGLHEQEQLQEGLAEHAGRRKRAEVEAKQIQDKTEIKKARVFERNRKQEKDEKSGDNHSDHDSCDGHAGNNAKALVHHNVTGAVVG